MGIGSWSWGQKSRGRGKQLRGSMFVGMEGVGFNRWDAATEEPHLPRLSVSVQPQVCICRKNAKCFSE